jgi:hypothetical protein
METFTAKKPATANRAGDVDSEDFDMKRTLFTSWILRYLLIAFFFVAQFVLSSCGTSNHSTDEKQETSSIEAVLNTSGGEGLTLEQQSGLSQLSQESRTALRLQLDPATNISVWNGPQLPALVPDYASLGLSLAGFRPPLMSPGNIELSKVNHARLPPIYNVKDVAGAFYQPVWSVTGDGPASEPCDNDKIEEVRQNAAEEGAKPEVKINCDLDLTGADIITKRLIFEGAAASGVTVNCNGATLDGGKNKINHGKDMVEVRSRSYWENGERKWERPENVTIKNCNIIGSVRLWGIAKNGEGTGSIYNDGEGDVNYFRVSSRTDSRHVSRARNNAPKNIVLDTLTITGVGRNPVYFAPGVTHSKLINSDVKGKSDHVAVYLDAESYGNTICGNDIHTSTGGDDYFGLAPDRPLIAIDASSHNQITSNRFSSLDHGGVNLYRNCGQGGTIRHSTPSHNQIMNNIFYYDKYKGANPAVYLGSRNRGSWTGYLNPWDFCGDDEGDLNVGSSASNKDYAQYNVIMRNQFYKRSIRKTQGFYSTLAEASVDDMIKSKDWRNNSGNEIGHNEMVTDETLVKDLPGGCYEADAYRRHLLPGEETISLFEGSTGSAL